MLDWEDLGQAMREKGLSYQDLARRTGYTKSPIHAAITGYKRGSEKLWRALADVLGVDAPPPPSSRGIPSHGGARIGTRAPDPARGAAMEYLKSAKRWHFTVGDKYDIDGVKLRYVKKEGVHHIFTAVRGGYRVSYTDAQLVDHDKKNQTQGAK